MMQQRLDLAPLDVSADRVLKDRAEEVLMSATHRRQSSKMGRCGFGSACINGYLSSPKRASSLTSIRGPGSVSDASVGPAIAGLYLPARALCSRCVRRQGFDS